MKQTLIKLSEQHYIVVDDSEIKEGDWYWTPIKRSIEQCIKKLLIIKGGQDDIEQFKITHSTQPLNKDFSDWFDAKMISLSEVEEVINEYNVEKMADKVRPNPNPNNITLTNTLRLLKNNYILGFNTHKELVKDKLLIDVEKFKRISYGFFSLYRTNNFDEEELEVEFERILNNNIKSLLPKTEWEVTFNEQGKIILL